MTRKNKNGGLGKGLSALLSSESIDMDQIGDFKALGTIAEIPINQIEANPFQPRTDFEQEALEELAESIKLHGIIQPVTLRKMGYENYQLISGERRTRAAILAGLQSLPAYIRVANDQDMLEMALIENIQRENLNAIEIALSYKRLMDECDLKQDQLGERVGKNRSTVSNYVRLLKLPDDIQAAIKNNQISMGHARALVGLKNELDQLDLFHRIVQEALSVRETEQVIKSIADSTPQNPQNPTAKTTGKPAWKSWNLNLPKNIKLKELKNQTLQIQIHVKDEDELRSILSKLS